MEGLTHEKVIAVLQEVERSLPPRRVYLMNDEDFFEHFLPMGDFRRDPAYIAPAYTWFRTTVIPHRFAEKGKVYELKQAGQALFKGIPVPATSPY